MTNSTAALERLDGNVGYAAPKNVIVRSRTGMAVILTAVAVGIGVALGTAFGATGVLLYGLTLPVPLVLLWLSADVVRADELRDHEKRGR